jgi:hypothetical protein
MVSMTVEVGEQFDAQGIEDVIFGAFFVGTPYPNLRNIQEEG